MSHMGLRAAVAGLVLCLVWGMARAERDTYRGNPPAKRSWWWPFGSSQKEELAKDKASGGRKSPDVKDKPPAVEKAKPPRSAGLSLAEKAALTAEEQAKFLRRQQVCLKLREIALATENPDLEAQARLLEQQAWLIYEQRTLRGRAPSLLSDEGSVAKRSLDEPSEHRRMAERPVRHVGRGPSDEEDQP